MNDITSVRILSLRFNQDFECFICGCNDGFRIFNSNPLRQIHWERLGPVVAVEMLFRTNYLAIVGGGYPLNNVAIWDSSLRKVVTVLDFDAIVISVRLTRNFIIAAHHTSITVYSFNDIPRKLVTFSTAINYDGLCVVSTTSNLLLAYPDSPDGSITIAHMSKCTKNASKFKAHRHPIANIAFDPTGQILASSSINGTVIRLFDSSSGSLFKEFRRGSNPAKISCINFSIDSSLICVSSNHSTIHLFQLSKPTNNLKQVEKYLKGGINVSFSRFHIKKMSKKQSAPSIMACSFDKDSKSVIALAADGAYYKFHFDISSGACTQENYYMFLELDKNEGEK